ncbi:DUF742 domain-containing protein [Plantactinospora sp. KLBMP9567]|uniref:DUF742 domain-containing protein n=1 Tax=Plantactinospora sp. KLBMP9567 TaxID=3085900 RepID=UPI002981966E|nr:DUF742 domain-containing protein [Plantactinospora sp. KLBMP9567]MDW5330533.1 DUF742 domain-containing protein [Plantactinospora sp. KLBMP9567]
MPFPPDESAEDQWVDDHAGPLVRPFALARGRTTPATGKFDLISIVIATRSAPTHEVGMGPEHLAIVSLIQRPLSVAEVAAHLKLPLGTVRVLLGDLLERQLLRVREPRPTSKLPDDDLFEAVISGLKAL